MQQHSLPALPLPSAAGALAALPFSRAAAEAAVRAVAERLDAGRTSAARQVGLRGSPGAFFFASLISWSPEGYFFATLRNLGHEASCHPAESRFSSSRLLKASETPSAMRGICIISDRLGAATAPPPI